MLLIKGTSKNWKAMYIVENKFEVFKKFAKKYNYKFGFVSDRNDELYPNNTRYIDNMSDESWMLLEEVL